MQRDGQSSAALQGWRVNLEVRVELEGGAGVGVGS